MVLPQRLACGLVLLAIAGSLSAGEIPGRETYAYGFALSGGDAVEFRAVQIPLLLYRSVADPDLRDVGVYNAAGEAVPRMIETVATGPSAAEQEITLGWVPLYGPVTEQGEQLRLLMLQDASGTSLSLDARAVAAKEAAAKPVPALAAYIVDLRSVERAPEALRLIWDETDNGFIGIVRIETSNDLQGWHELMHATLADLSWEGNRIEQNRVELASAPGDFLRISWSGLPAEWALHALTGIRRGDGPAENRDWLTLDPSAIDEQRREFGFDSGAFAPVDRINLVLPDDNVVLRARILYRDHQGDSWRPAYEGVFYHVSRQGRSVQSDPVTVPQVRAREWQVQIESGSASGALQLQLGWQPERLLFLAQGEAPF